jgi:O-antigen/teichoic acid export membrane protein
VTFAFWVNVWTSIPLAAVVAAVCASFASGPVMAVVAATAFALGVSSTGIGWFQGHENTGWIAVLKVAEVVVKLLAGAVLVLVFGGSALAALGGALVASVVLFAGFAPFVRLLGRPSGFRQVRGLWIDALRMGALQVGVAVLGSADTLVAAITGGGRQVASYQVAATLGRIPLFVSGALATAVFAALVGPHAARGRAVAVRSYVLVAGFGWLALATAPPSVLAMVFPERFPSLHHWLLFTAPLGAVMGLVSLLVTFVQVQQRGWTGHVVVGVAVLAFLLALGAGARLAGVQGLAAAAVSVAVASGAALLLLESQRSLLVDVARCTPWAWAVPGGVLTVLLLRLTASEPVLWLGAATACGLGVVVCAFPEVASGVRRLRGAVPLRPGRASR